MLLSLFNFLRSFLPIKEAGLCILNVWWLDASKVIFREKVAPSMVVHLLQHNFFFYKIFIICKKKCFYMEKKNLYREKYKWKCKKIYLISEVYSYTENVCVTKKNFIILSEYSYLLKFVVNSIIWPVKFRKQSICGIPYTNSSQKHKGTSWKKSMRVFILSKVESWRLGK